MGRLPSNGGPSFRFNPAEVAEMEAILQAHNCAVPAREILESLAQKFSASAERSGKVEIQVKQVWNWFQNRRYALRAKAAKAPAPRNDPSTVRHVPQAPQPQPAPQATPSPISSGQTDGKSATDNSVMEFEAKSARDGAWYDVSTFLSHRSLETGDPEVLVRFAGFGPEEDEWVNVRKHVRQRSLPCESSECVAVLPGDLILCFQEGKEQALYFDAHVLDAQRRRHDVRGCRCRFLVRYDHDQSEEIVPLRKICRRPETDYRLQQLHAESMTANPQETGGKTPKNASSMAKQVNSPAIATPDNSLGVATSANLPAILPTPVNVPSNAANPVNAPVIAVNAPAMPANQASSLTTPANQAISPTMAANQASSPALATPIIAPAMATPVSAPAMATPVTAPAISPTQVNAPAITPIPVNSANIATPAGGPGTETPVDAPAIPTPENPKIEEPAADSGAMGAPVIPTNVPVASNSEPPQPPPEISQTESLAGAGNENPTLSDVPSLNTTVMGTSMAVSAPSVQQG